MHGWLISINLTSTFRTYREGHFFDSSEDLEPTARKGVQQYTCLSRLLLFKTRESIKQLKRCKSFDCLW